MGRTFRFDVEISTESIKQKFWKFMNMQLWWMTFYLLKQGIWIFIMSQSVQTFLSNWFSNEKEMCIPHPIYCGVWRWLPQSWSQPNHCLWNSHHLHTATPPPPHCAALKGQNRAWRYMPHHYTIITIQIQSSNLHKRTENKSKSMYHITTSLSLSNRRAKPWRKRTENKGGSTYNTTTPWSLSNYRAITKVKDRG